MTDAARAEREREPICGLCWAEKRIVPLEYLPEAHKFVCPWCGAHIETPADRDDEEELAAQAFYYREGWDPKLSGRPPWQTGLHQTRAKLPRTGRRTGRRRRRERKWKPWYQRGGAV